jgi:hypothetical protein
MNLYINSPSYYTQKHGVIDEIHILCKKISQNIDICEYTDEIDTIGITPIIAPINLLEQGLWKEEKKVRVKYRMANISLQVNYDTFFNADIEEKERLILNNIVDSLLVVNKKLKQSFDFERIRQDIYGIIS